MVTISGTLNQPFLTATDGTFNKLTFSTKDFDYALKVAEVSQTFTGSNPTIDTSGFTSSSTSGGFNIGYGTITVENTVPSPLHGGATITLKRSYTLPNGSSDLAIGSKVIVASADVAGDGVQVWIGTGDDWLGDTDRPAKETSDGTTFTAASTGNCLQLYAVRP